MVPLVGIMFGNVIGGITNYLAYKYEMTQALSSWLVGHFSLVLKGRYEIVWLTVPLVILAFFFANHFNIVGLGKDFSKNLGVLYNLVLFLLTIAAMITASIVVVVGSMEKQVTSPLKTASGTRTIPILYPQVVGTAPRALIEVMDALYPRISM